MCLICERNELSRKGENPFFIKEFKHSYFVVGDHQFFKGYSLLVLKDHVEDLTDLSEEIQAEYLSEVTVAAKILKKHFKAKRINYSCLGNFVPHVHFHLFPRYEEDLADDKTKNPWHCIDRFDEFKLEPKEAQALALEIRELL